MDIFLDNQIISKITRENIRIDLDLSNVVFNWSSLLEWLNLGDLFSTLPKFEHSKLFDVFVSSLAEATDVEIHHNLYDHLFRECLIQIKSLKEVDAAFLLEAIHNQKQFAQSVKKYEDLLQNDPKNALHDLTLYLAWDRMCVYISNLFDYQSEDPKFQHGLKVLRDCLIESYQHISDQKRTAPSLYRLIEALFFYEMREENLQTHGEADWEVLSRIAPHLKSNEKIVDMPYIDAVEPMTIYTLDSNETVELNLKLAKQLIKPFHLRSEVICLKQKGDLFCRD